MAKQLTGILTLLLAVSVAGLGYGFYKYNLLSKELLNTQTDLDQSNQNVTSLKASNDYILKKLSDEQGRNSEFASQINDILSTVGTLDKLSKTDKELLQKYSKVYFLNEHYVPENLSAISGDYAYDKAKSLMIHTSVLPFLSRMIADAKSAGNPLEIISSYRSFADQNSLKNSYKVTYGSGANAFSADQGYSEHQLGTALDFTTPELGANFSAFKSTDAYQWLSDNAHKYGFALSYPENNSYYEFEPWHWRFVGVKLATRLHNEGQHFYDLDQRTIDNYLINIFE